MLVVLVFRGAAFGMDGRALPPTDVETYEDGGDPKARSAAYRAAHPEWDDVFARFTKRFEQLPDQFPSGVALSAAQAAALIDELYYDSGNSRLNHRWQDRVLDFVASYGLRPNTPTDAIEVLRTGLIEYEKAGGGGTGPSLRMQLASAFCAVGDESHPEFERKAEALVKVAMEEVNQNGSEVIRRTYGYGLKYLDYVYSRLEELGRIKPGASEFQRWTACEGSLRRLESAENPDTQLIDRAAGAVAGCSGAAGKPGEADPLERLLAAYQKIAERKPGAAKEVIRAIDGRLLWLAQDSGKIDSVRRWDRWADAVAALRFRGSNDLGRFVHRKLKDEKDDEVRGAMERAEAGLASR